MTKFLLYMKIAGTEISDKKHVVISLQGIFGIGATTSKKILDKLKISQTKKVKDLTDMEQQKIAEELENYTITNDLNREIINNINRLVAINCYRGKRLKAGLPSHGQRTHTNGKTAKRNSKFSIKKVATPSGKGK
jgi:small subunit ribosomal protein S13